MALAGLVGAQPAAADSLSSKDVQIVVKALSFLDPAPAGGVVAVVYAGADASSKADADAITHLFGAGLPGRGGTVTAKSIDVAALGDGSGYIAIIIAAGVQSAAPMTAAKAHRIPAISASPGLVQSGHCVMTVKSEPKVEITVNRDAAQSAGIGFASAFRMLIHEI